MIIAEENLGLTKVDRFMALQKPELLIINILQKVNCNKCQPIFHYA
jgi:hypothetical protein